MCEYCERVAVYMYSIDLLAYMIVDLYMYSRSTSGTLGVPFIYCIIVLKYENSTRCEKLKVTKAEMARARLIAGLAMATFVTITAVFHLLKAASKRLIDDCFEILEWLAWRDERVASYDPPTSSPTPSSMTGAQLIKVDALVVHGCSMVAVPQGAADLFVDVLYPAGCRTVLITGGVGRETPPLWDELAKHNLTELVGWRTAWPLGSPPPTVDLPTRGVHGKPVLGGVELDMEPDKVRRYCTEADVFLELFVARCKERGVAVAFGGNPIAGEEGAPASVVGARAFVETGSTHTGTNVEYSRASLRVLGFGEEPTVAVVQQPQLQRRTCLTWERQTGRRPVSWTIRPTPACTGRSTAELLRYALGEVRRIPSYAAADKGFCTMPPDFPHHLVPSLIAYEPALTAALDVEARAAAQN